MTGSSVEAEPISTNGATTAAPFQAVERRVLSQYFEGPLPPPAMLAEYERIVPGAADRIMKFAEARHAMVQGQAVHRQAIEVKVIESKIANERLGQIIAFVVVMTCVCGSILCALMGCVTFASILGGTTVTSLASVFYFGKRMQRRELQAKSQLSEHDDKKTEPSNR